MTVWDTEPPSWCWWVDSGGRYSWHGSLPVEHLASSPCSGSCIGIVSAGGLVPSLWRTTCRVGNSLGGLGIFHGTLWTPSQLDVAQCCYGGCTGWREMASCGFAFPIALQFYLDRFHRYILCIYFKKLILCKVSVLFIWLNFSCLSSISFLALFSCRLLLILPSTHDHLFYFSFLGRSIYPLTPSSIPNFCALMDCGLVIIDLTANIHI